MPEVKISLIVDSSGAVQGIRTASGEIAQIEAAAKAATSATDNTGDSIMRMAGMVTGIAGVAGAILGIKEAASVSLNYLGHLETATLGIASGLLSNGKYVDELTGKALVGQQALNAAQQEARGILEQLQVANFQTIATLDQLVRAYQETLPVAMSKGFNTQMVKDFTVAVVQAAGAIGLPMDQLAEETRSLLSATINPRNSRIGVALGLTNEDIREASGNAQQLFDFLMTKLDAYRIAGIESQNTWAGLWSNTKDIALQVGGQVLQPLFESIKYELKEIASGIMTIEKTTDSAGKSVEKIKWNPEFNEGVKTTKTVVIDIIAEFYRMGMLLDKIGGSATALGSLLPGSWGKASAAMNKTFEENYLKSEKALMAMAMSEQGYVQLTNKMMEDAGMGAKKFVTTTIDGVTYVSKESMRITTDYQQKSQKESEEARKQRANAMELEAKSILAVSKDVYDSEMKHIKSLMDERRREGEYEVSIQKWAADQKEEALNEWYNASLEALEKDAQGHKLKKTEGFNYDAFIKTKTAALDSEYAKKQEALEDEELQANRKNADEAMKISADMYGAIDKYSYDSYSAQLALIERERLARINKTGDVLGATLEATEKERALYEAKSKAIIETELKYYNTVVPLGQRTFDLKVEQMNQEKDAFIKTMTAEADAATALALWEEYLARKKKDLAIQTDADIYNAKLSAIRDIKGYEGQAYEYEVQLINLKKQKMKDAGVSEVEINAWALNEQKKAWIVYAQHSDSVMNGIKAAYLDMTSNMMTWGQAAFDMTKEVFSQTKSMLGNVFFDTIKGDLKSFEDYWGKFWDSMLKKMTDVLADMAVNWLMSQVSMGNYSYNPNAKGAAIGAGNPLTSMLSPLIAGGTIAGAVLPVGTGAGAAGMTGGLTVGQALSAGYTPEQIAAAMPESAFTVGGQSLGSLLAPAALGFAGGSMVGGLIGGDSTGGGIGGAVGAVAGSMFATELGTLLGTALLPGVGSLIGGALGTVIGAFGEDIVSGIGDAISSVGDFIGDIFDWHTGGVIGMGGGSPHPMPVPVAAFAGAPRLHTGFSPFRSDEYPAVLRRGEEVLTEDNPRHIFNAGKGSGGGDTYVFQIGTLIADRISLDELAIQIYERTSRMKRIGAFV